MNTGGITSSSGRDQFLQLLVTQLKNQDPLAPVDQQNFISELAQFSQLEGIEKLNTNFEDMLKLQQMTQGASMIGQEALYQSSDGSSRLREGTIEAVTSQSGTLYLVIRGEGASSEFVPLSMVRSIGVPSRP